MLVPLKLWKAKDQIINDVGYKKPEMFWKIIYPLHQIKQQQLIRGEDTPICINRKTLESIMGGEATHKILTYLKKVGLLKITRKFNADEGVSNQYKLVLDSPWSEVDLDASESRLVQKLLRKYHSYVGRDEDSRKAFVDLNKFDLDLNKVYNKLSKHIHITNKVKQYITQTQTTHTALCALLSSEDIEFTEYGKEQDELYKKCKNKHARRNHISFVCLQSQLYKIRCIYQKRFYCFVDTFNRLHHTITSLKTDFRECITYRGGGVESLDVACSQPSILAVFAKEELKKAPIEEQEAIKQDVDLFSQLAETGELYDYLIKKSGYQGKRGDFKRAFFKDYLYGNENRMYDTEIGSLTRDVFPNMSRLIYNFKAAGNGVDEKGNKIYGYKRLPQMMQIIEGNIVRVGATNKLRDDYDVPHILIFDEVIVPKGYGELAKALIEESFKEFGLYVTVKVK